MKYFRFFLIPLLMLVAILPAYSAGTAERVMPPKVELGVIDLRGWDFVTHGNVTLAGAWEFYWNSFIDPKLPPGKENGVREYAKVPGVWNASSDGKPPYPEYGFATYRLTIRLGKTAGPMAFKIEEMTTAYALFVDGEPLLSSGKIGKSMEEMTPEFLPKTVYFTPTRDTIDLVIHISNFWNNRGGLWKNIYFGTQKGILSYEGGKNGFDYFVAGALLVMFIYHFILFFLERRNWSALFFGLFCFLMAVRAVLNDERIIYDFIPYIGWNIAQRLELLTTYLGVPVFALFFRSLYPDEAGKRATLVFIGAGVLWSIVAVAVPPTLISFTFDVFQYVLYAMCAFVLFALVRAIMAGRYGSILFAIGFAILASAIVNDILYSQFVIYTAFVTPFGLVIGLFFAEVALNVKFVRTEQAFEKSEEKLRVQQEQLVHADKLVALGTLTAGVAHEINNPNNAILLASQVNEEAFSKIVSLLDEALEEKGGEVLGGFSYDELVTNLKESFSRVTRNSRRIKQIVGDLKSFAGKDSGVLDQEVDLNPVVESALRLLENPIKKCTRRFTVRLGTGVPRVRGNSQRLEQVVINIVQNACYALEGPDKGIAVTTGYDEGANEAFIEVADEGIGMDDRTKRRIFDPFFTTRRGTGGTGLGLSISARIVADHGGRIEIDSEKGKGTKMRVVLPAILKQE